jgi:putative endonuclease
MFTSSFWGPDQAQQVQQLICRVSNDSPSASRCADTIASSADFSPGGSLSQAAISVYRSGSRAESVRLLVSLVSQVPDYQPKEQSSNPLSRTRRSVMFAYTYVLRCCDGDMSIGSTLNLKRRVIEHEEGKEPATAHRRPPELVYYEGCKSEVQARPREKGLKTGFGRRYLKARLGVE